MYQLRFTYLDGAEFNVNLAKKDYHNFFEALLDKKLFFTEESKAGFWTDRDKIRYILVQELPPSTEENSLPTPIEVQDEMVPTDKVSE